MDSDFWLIHRMKNGDDQAVDLFVRKYYPAIFRYCRLHIKDPGDAEDMAQETFVRFFLAFNEYRHYGKALNYLYVIAANACKDHGRKKEALPMLPMDELPRQPAYEMESPELWIDIHTAIEGLPQELKETAILYFFQEVRQTEIAKILGIGLPLVKYRVQRARKLLSVVLGKE